MAHPRGPWAGAVSSSRSRTRRESCRGRRRPQPPTAPRTPAALTVGASSGQPGKEEWFSPDRSPRPGSWLLSSFRLLPALPMGSFLQSQELPTDQGESPPRAVSTPLLTPGPSPPRPVLHVDLSRPHPSSHPPTCSVVPLLLRLGPPFPFTHPTVREQWRPSAVL